MLFVLVLGTTLAAGAAPAVASSGQPGPISLYMSCVGPGPNGTVAAGQTDNCAVSLSGGTLPAGSTVLLTPPSPAATSVSCSPPGQLAGCSFGITNTIVFHGYIGTETIQFAPDGPSQGGGASLTQQAKACTPTCNFVPVRIDGPGNVVGTPFRPRFMPSAPFAYKLCRGPNPDGTVSETQVDTCLIYTSGLGGPYIAGDIVTIARVSPLDATTVMCGDGPYSDAGARLIGSVTTSCSYRFSTSVTGGGVLIGTEVLAIPSTVVPGAAVLQDVTFCPAPQPAGQISSCATSPMSVTGPGANVVDEIPPAFSLPPDMTVDATGPTDTVVQYPAPAATDNAPGAVSINCTPASGAMFAVGITAVMCTATDVSGNTATASFTVTVQNTFDSLCRVTTLEVGKEGLAHSLCAKLQGAADAGAAGDSVAAAGKLGAYINEVEAQGDKSLTAQQAQDLESLAQLLMP